LPTIRTRTTDLTGGEWAGTLRGRVDLERFKRAAKRLENYVILSGGGLTRRPGTRYVAQAAGFARLVRWEYNATDSYVLELSAARIRFYRNLARVESGGNPVEVTTTYLESELRTLQFTQSADTLFIVHGDHPPAILQRLSSTLWRLRDFVFDVPPSYEYGERPAATGTPSATSGAGVTFTASAASFLNADIGRDIEVTAGASLGAKARITGFTSTTVVTVTVTENFADTTAIPAGSWRVKDSPLSTVTPSAKEPAGLTTATLTASVATWRAEHVGKFVLLNNGVFEITSLGSSTVANVTIRGEADDITASPAGAWTLEEAAFSVLNGYPAAVTIFDDRLTFAGTRAQPQTRWSSKTGDYGNFAGGALDDDGLTQTLNSDQVNAITWITGKKALVTGTAGGEWVLRLADGDVLTPSTLGDRPETNHGSTKELAPLAVGNVTLFATRSRRKLRELVFSFEVDTYVAPDLLRLADHLTDPVRIAGTRVSRRIVDLAFQREPTPTIWAVREDGTLLGCTYLRDENVVGWSRHITGTPATDPQGFAIPAAGDGVIESVAVIQHPDGDRDQVWLSIRRIVQNQTRRYVEVMDDTGLFYAKLLADASLTVDGTSALDLTPSVAGPVGTAVTLTATGAAFTAGDVGKEARLLTGSGRALITGYTSAMVVTGTITLPFASTATIPAGTWGLATTSVSGLAHLEGKTVSVVGDGALYQDQVVAGGTVALNPAYAAIKIEVGLNYTALAVPHPPEIEQLGTIQGLKQRYAELRIRLHETLGARVNGKALDFRTAPDPMGAAIPLFTGDVKVETLGKSQAERELLTIEQPYPLPQTVLLISGTLNSED